MRTFIYFFLAITIVLSHKLADFGAIPNDSSYESTIINGKALEKALLTANSSLDKFVLVEPHLTYHMLPSATISQLYNIILQIEGNIVA